MPRVLLLDTNVSAGPLLQSLLGLGAEVFIAGGNPADVLARSFPNYVQLDYSDAEATLKLIDDLGVDFLIPGCNDRSYQTCAEIAERRPFPGIDGLETTRIINNKAAFRAWAQARGLPVPRTLMMSEAHPGRPVIVKPEEAYSGRGATVLRSPTPETLAAAQTAACTASRSGKCLIEEFVEGQLYSHTAFVGPSGVLVDVVVEEHGSANPLAVDTSHVIAAFPPSPLARIRAAVAQICDELRLDPGLMHTQFILDGERVFIIEITRRCPGDLYGLLIELSTGLNYAENYVRPFLGLPFRFVATAAVPAPILRHTISAPHHSRFGSLRFLHSLDIERYISLALSGEDIAPSPSSRIGLLFARAKNGEDLAAIKAAALGRRLYDIVPPEVW